MHSDRWSCIVIRLLSFGPFKTLSMIFPVRRRDYWSYLSYYYFHTFRCWKLCKSFGLGHDWRKAKQFSALMCARGVCYHTHEIPTKTLLTYHLNEPPEWHLLLLLLVLKVIGRFKNFSKIFVKIFVISRESTTNLNRYVFRGIEDEHIQMRWQTKANWTNSRRIEGSEMDERVFSEVESSCFGFHWNQTNKQFRDIDHSTQWQCHKFSSWWTQWRSTLKIIILFIPNNIYIC